MIGIVVDGTRANGSTYQEVTTSNRSATMTIAEDFLTINSLELRFNRSNSVHTDTTSVFEELMLNIGTTALPYRPYFKRTLPIPEAVKNLPDYGEGAPFRDYYNRIHWRYDDATGKSMREYERHAWRITVYGTSDIKWDSNYQHTVSCPVSSFFDIPSVVIAGGICNRYEPFVQSSEIGVKDGVYLIHTSSILITDSRFTDLDTAKEILNAEPVELTLYLVNNKDAAHYYEVTDISDILTDDNFIEVEGGGSITAVNEFGYAVPTTINYATDIGE
jgi:hypothetical protein